MLPQPPPVIIAMVLLALLSLTNLLQGEQVVEQVILGENRRQPISCLSWWECLGWLALGSCGCSSGGRCGWSSSSVCSTSS